MQRNDLRHLRMSTWTNCSSSSLSVDRYCAESTSTAPSLNVSGCQSAYHLVWYKYCVASRWPELHFGHGGGVCVSIFQIAETHVRGGVLHPHCVYRLQEDDDDDDRGSSEQGDVLSDLKARSPKETANHRWKRTLLQLSVLPSSQPQKRQLHPLRHRTASTWDPVRSRCPNPSSRNPFQAQSSIVCSFHIGMVGPALLFQCGQ